MRGRIARVCVLGVEILVLEARYVDDYCCLWKCAAGVPQALLDMISGIVKKWPQDRYPLPMTRDSSQKFVGIVLSSSGLQVKARPHIQALPAYNEASHLPLMHFSSYGPMSMKRAVLIGILARIDTYTVPSDARPQVLLEATRFLVRRCAFPPHLVRRWALQYISIYKWIQDVCWAE